MNRIKNSFGQFHIHDGNPIEINEEKYKIDYSRKFYLFDIIPTSAPRMSQSDKWKTNPNHQDPKKRQREVVTKYFAFKDNLRWQAKQMNYEFKNYLDFVFIVPIPNSFSEKKKERLNGTPVKTKPDIDNYVKAFMDSLKSEDGDVWFIKAIKVYGFKGSILVYA
jgi:Holliday junction resolvase RusA-like endonuclease